MRNNLKHLLLGMSLGAVVVLIYGYQKLTPLTVKQAHTPESIVETEAKNISVDTLIEPNIAKDLSVNFDEEVRFVDIYELYNIDPEKEKEDGAQIALDNDVKQVNNEVNINEIDNSVENIIKPEVAFYVYETPKKQTGQDLFDQLQPPFMTKEDKQTPAPTPEPTPTAKLAIAYSPPPNTTSNAQESNGLGAQENIIALIEKYAAEYGVDINMMIGIAKCESGFRENAVNGPYAGIYQFVSGTWISNRRAMGLDENLDLRYNAEESIRTAAFKMSRDGFGAWPVCQYKAQVLIAVAK